MNPLSVRMASDSNMQFRDGFNRASSYNTNMVSFHSGVTSGSTGGMNSSIGFCDSSRSFVSGNPALMNNACAAIQDGASSRNALLEPVPRLKRETGLPAVWSSEEQATLREGLVRYDGEPSIMKYIKIAATLREKNVRDVALQCRWMNKEHIKRRKPDEQYARRKLKDTKEKMMGSYLKGNENVRIVPSDSSQSTAFYSFMMHHVNHNDRFPYEDLDGPLRNLMDENALVFNQIAANLLSSKTQDNINMFLRTRNNITAILNSMSEMPGVMSMMHPLPVSVNEQLLNNILPGTSQVLIFRGHGGINLKNEPR